MAFFGVVDHGEPPRGHEVSPIGHVEAVRAGWISHQRPPCLIGVGRGKGAAGGTRGRGGILMVWLTHVVSKETLTTHTNDAETKRHAGLVFADQPAFDKGDTYQLQAIILALTSPIDMPWRGSGGGYGGGFDALIPVLYNYHMQVARYTSPS